MPESFLDHLVVTAPRLEIGVAYVERQLGTSMTAGGQHVRMGTHNAVLRIGDRLYLEVISIDPAADPIERSRWFGLDHVSEQDAPRLSTWIVRTNNIDRLAPTMSIFPGPIEPMSRGLLKWRITIPTDGTMPFGGIVPGLIEWEPGFHPAEKMPDTGVKLTQLQLIHPNAEAVNQTLNEIGIVHDILVPAAINGERPQLIATFQTQHGFVVLR